MTSLPLARAFTCLLMFVYIRARARFALIGGNLTAQSTGRHKGIGGEIQIPKKDVVASSPFFPAPPPERPGEFARRLASLLNTVTTSK